MQPCTEPHGEGCVCVCVCVCVCACVCVRKYVSARVLCVHRVPNHMAKGVCVQVCVRACECMCRFECHACDCAQNHMARKVCVSLCVCGRATVGEYTHINMCICLRIIVCIRYICTLVGT